MSKIAGLKGRSPETYPSYKASGFGSQSNVNASPVVLTTGLTSLLTAVIDVLPGVKNVVMWSGYVETSGANVLVSVEVVLDGSGVYTTQVEVKTANSPAPISLVFETEPLASTPNPHTIDIKGTASVGGSTATVEAGSSVVVLSTSF